MIFDDLGWSLMIFRNHDFFCDFTRFYQLHHLEESASHPLPLLEGVPQVCGAKHSPPARCPFGSPNGHLATLAKIMPKLTPLCPMSSPMVPWIKEIQRVKIRTYV